MSITHDNAADIVRETMDAVVDWRNHVVRELAARMHVSEYVAESILEDHKERDLQDISCAASEDGPYKLIADYVASVGFNNSKEAEALALGVRHVFRAAGDAKNAEVALVFGSYVRDSIAYGGHVIWI